jgi:hypothetical protein
MLDATHYKDSLGRFQVYDFGATFTLFLSSGLRYCLSLLLLYAATVRYGTEICIRYVAFSWSLIRIMVCYD